MIVMIWGSQLSEMFSCSQKSTRCDCQEWVTRSSIKLFWTAKKWEMTIPLCAVLLCCVLCMSEQTPCKAAYHLAPIYLHCRHLTALQNTNIARFSDEKLWLPSQGKGREWSACPHIRNFLYWFCFKPGREAQTTKRMATFPPRTQSCR